MLIYPMIAALCSLRCAILHIDFLEVLLIFFSGWLGLSPPQRHLHIIRHVPGISLERLATVSLGRFATSLATLLAITSYEVLLSYRSLSFIRGRLGARLILGDYHEGTKGGFVIPFHAQVLTRFTCHVYLKQQNSRITFLF